MLRGKPVSLCVPQNPPRELALETLGVGVHVLECYPHCVPGSVGVVSVFLLLLMSSSSLLVISQTDPQTCDEGFNCHGDGKIFGVLWFQPCGQWCLGDLHVLV